MNHSATVAAARTNRRNRVDQPEPEVRCLGDWTLGGLLAESSVSSVFLGRPSTSPPESGYPYAIKVLKPRWCKDERAVAMFAVEAHVGRTVTHPNLASVLFARTSANPPFLIMPRYEGQTLASVTRSGERLPLPTSLWVLRQASEALHALHKADWMHGDVKPHNLLLADDGHVTLLDLGFARPKHEPTGIAARPLLGTLRYIAPEMLRSSVEADHRSDLYSLGVVAYELIAGRPPFPGKSAGDFVRQHCHEQPPALRKFAPSTPDELVRLIDRLLAKNPQRRPDTLQEVIERLVRLEIDTLGERIVD